MGRGGQGGQGRCRHVVASRRVGDEADEADEADEGEKGDKETRGRGDKKF
jgi:hypothetical protein